jgi:hypothetical protein
MPISFNISDLPLKIIYTAMGIFFGLSFPIIGTILRLTQNGKGLDFILSLHRSDALIQIIDTAPFFLGLFAYLIGKKHYIFGIFIGLIAILLNISYFVPKDWLDVTDNDKFSGVSWQKQMTISIFDYLPKSATLPPINEAPRVPEILDGEVKVVSYTKGSNFQYGKLEVEETSTIRLPIFFFQDHFGHM